jgi:hypothetical protein
MGGASAALGATFGAVGGMVVGGLVGMVMGRIVPAERHIWAGCGSLAAASSACMATVSGTGNLPLGIGVGLASGVASDCAMMAKAAGDDYSAQRQRAAAERVEQRAAQAAPAHVTMQV